MFRLHSLRARIALYFAGFGALLSLVMAVMVYQSAHDLSVRLIDETLTAELDDYIARRERNPLSLPPSTVTLQGFVREASETDGVPDYLATLPPGRHEIRVGTLSYRAAVLDRDNARYYLLYDISLNLKRERRFALPLIVSSIVLFYVGVAFAYYVVFPLMFQFLASTTPTGVKMMTDIANYLDFVLLLFMAFGIAFEMPVAVVLLVVTGLVKLDVLTRNRGYVILGIFIIAAFLTPPDAVSQSFMAVPMYLLYELGILFARMIQKSRGTPAIATES